MTTKKHKIAVSIMFVLFFMTGAVLGVPGIDVAEAKTLKIGTIMPISGPLGAIGVAWNRGFEILLEKVNGAGGIDIKGEKYTVRVIMEDGKMSPEACSAAANKLVYKDKVKFVMGEVMEPDSEAIYNVTREAGVFMGLANSLVPTPLGPWGVGADKPLMVLLTAPAYLGYPYTFDYVKEAYPGLKRAVTTDNTFPHEPLIEFNSNALKERGFDVVGVERYDLAAPDFYPFMTAVLKHKPDLINIGQSAPLQIGMQIKAARELGFTGPIISTSQVAPDFALMGAGPKMATDIIVAAPYAEGPDVPEDMKYVVDAWKKKYKEPFNADVLLGFDALWVLIQSIEKAQSLDPQTVADKIQSLNTKGDIKTVYGPGYFGGKKAVGANLELIAPYWVSLVKDGVIKNVKCETTDH
jgi:branched-chain amino acid transport system substrate-binding protein